MRDAAVYVVALFMPLALAASIWPRWSGALRRSAELLVVVDRLEVRDRRDHLARRRAARPSGGQVEHILAASALMLLACFAPFVLFRLVPFAEGAMAAAYGRRSAGGGAMSGVQLASERADPAQHGALQLGPRLGRDRWPERAKRRRPRPRARRWRTRRRRPGEARRRRRSQGRRGSRRGRAAGAGAAAGAPVAAAASVPSKAAHGAKAAAERLGQSGTATAGGAAAGSEQGAGAQPQRTGEEDAPRLRAAPRPRAQRGRRERPRRQARERRARSLSSRWWRPTSRSPSRRGRA